MKIHNVSQFTPEGTANPEWLALRTKYPTASECDKLITPAKLEVSASLDKYVAYKLAERWIGSPLQSFSGSAAMAQGKLREVDARNWYGMKMGVDVETPGFITTDDEKLGCSPDGLVLPLNRILEIKSPEPNTHVAWWLAGGLPGDHRIQVQAEMKCCNFEEADFLSHCPGDPDFPPLLVTVKKERDVWDALDDALEKFWKQYNQGWSRLLDSNGGKEPVHQFDVMYGENWEIVKTLKPEFMSSPDPIGDILEMAK